MKVLASFLAKDISRRSGVIGKHRLGEKTILEKPTRAKIKSGAQSLVRDFEICHRCVPRGEFVRFLTSPSPAQISPYAERMLHRFRPRAIYFAVLGLGKEVAKANGCSRAMRLQVFVYQTGFDAQELARLMTKHMLGHRNLILEKSPKQCSKIRQDAFLDWMAFSLIQSLRTPTCWCTPTHCHRRDLNLKSCIAVIASNG